MKNFKRRINILSLFLLITITACQLNPFASQKKEINSVNPTSVQSVDSEIHPYINTVNPVNKTTISINQIFEVVFNQPMNQASVEAALEFNPRIAGSFDWPDENRMRFIPDQQLILDQDIQMKIGGSAASKSGETLGAPSVFIYNVAPALRMTFNMPSFEEKEVSPQMDAFYVSFNLPVVDFSQSQNNFPAAFRIEPALPGQGKWISSSTFGFFPERGLVGNENYKLIMNRQLKSVYGSILEVDQSMEWNFQTSAPEVLSVLPSNEQQVALNQEFTFFFNQPMQTESVAINFRFHDIAGSPVPGRFVWNETFTEMQFVPEQLLDRGRVYIMELLPGSQMKGGGVISEPIELSYSTIQTLAILSTNPADGQPIDLINTNNSVNINFSTSLDPTMKLGEFIKVFPDVENLGLNFGDDGKSVTIQADFITGVSYQILISKDIRDRWAGHLNEDAILNFVVSPSRPNIEINHLYDSHTMIIRPEIYALDVEVINLPTVDTKIYRLDFLKYINLIKNTDQLIEEELVYDFRQPLTPLSNKQVQTSLLLNLKKEGLVPGIYAVELSAEQMQTKRFFVFVNQDFIVSKLSENQLFVWATETGSLEPVKNQLITIKNDQAEVIYEEITNEQGVLIWDSFYGTNPTRSVWIEIKDVETQKYSLMNSSWIDTSLPESFGLNYQERQEKYSVYWSLDKTVYSIREELTGYGFIHLNEFGELRPPDFQEINLNLVGFSDPNQILYRFPVRVSASGSFIFSEKLPAQLANGSYYLTLDGLDVEKKIIQIQNKPLSQEFSLGITLSKPEYFYNDDFTARIELNYRYGDFDKNIKFNWRVVAKELNPLVFNSYDLNTFELSSNTADEQYFLIDEGADVLDELGNYDIKFPITELETYNKDKNVPYLISIEVNVGSENEYIAFNSKQAIVYPDRTNIFINLDSFYEQRNQIDVGFVSFDWKGAATGGINFGVKFQKLIKTNVGNIFENQWIDLFQEDLRSDGLGNASVSIFPNGPGIYKVVAANNMFYESKVFFLAGQALTEFPIEKNGHLPLAVNKNEYIEGEMVQLFVPNPFPEPAVALITVEKENVSFYDLVQVESGQKLINLNLDLSDVGSHFVSVVMISKNTQQIVQGYTMVKKNANLDQLLISVEPNAIELNKMDITVSDNQGNPVQSELTIQVVQKDQPTIINDFYNLKNQLLFSDKIGVITAGVIHNKALPPFDLENQTILKEITVPLQKNNPILWQKIISTDSNGNYILDLSTVPIDPIKEKLSVIGVDESFQFGYTSVEIPSAKTVETSIKIPDSVYEGDIFEVFVTLTNMEEETQNIQATVDLRGFTSNSTQVVNLSLPVGSPRSFFWKVNADTTGEHEILIQIINPEGDVYLYEQKITVLPTPKSRQYVKTGKIEKRSSIDIQFLTSRYQENPASILNIGLITSLSGILNPAVASLSVSPEFENEETALILLSTIDVLQLEKEMAVFGPLDKNATSEIIRQQIRHLVENQNIDGGWGINPAQRSSEMQATLISTWALWSAQKNGYSVSIDVFEKATTYILAGLPDFDMLAETMDYDLLAWQYYVLALLKVENIDPLVLLQNIDSYSSAGKAMISLGINEVWPVDPRSLQILTDLKNDITTVDSTQLWRNNFSTIRLFANDIQSSAFIVYAIAKQDPADEIMVSVIDSIYSQQTKMWAWENTYESGLAIMAISASVLGRGFLGSDFSASATLNETEIIAVEPPFDPFVNAVQAQIGDYPLLTDDENILKISHGEGQGNLYYYIDLESVEADYGLYVPTNKVAINRVIVQGESSSDVNCSIPDLCKLSEISTFKTYSPIDVMLQVTVFEKIDHMVIKDIIPAGFTVIDSPYLLENEMLEKFEPLISASESMFAFQITEGNTLVYYAETIPSGTYYIHYTLLPEFLGRYYWPAIDLFSFADDAISTFSPGLMVEISP